MDNLPPLIHPVLWQGVQDRLRPIRFWRTTGNSMASRVGNVQLWWGHSSAYETGFRNVITHELGHLWDHWGLDNDTRNNILLPFFCKHAEPHAWMKSTDSWWYRVGEAFAEALNQLAWGQRYTTTLHEVDPNQFRQILLSMVD